MFLPLYDIAPLRNLKAAHVTRAIMALTTLVWLANWMGIPPGGADSAAVLAGLFPAVLFHHAVLPPELHAVPAPLTLITSLFLHGGLVHLVGNMLFLQVFGDSVEDSMGHGRFVLFYLLCGAAGGLAHAAAHPFSEEPLIGASSAVAGVIGAYLVLHPRALVWGLVLNVVPVKISAYWVLSLWLLIQVWHVWSGDEASTAWFAHLGGFLAGIVLVLLFRRRPLPASVPKVP